MAFASKQKKCFAGLSVSRSWIELSVYSPKTSAIVESARIPTPLGMLDHEGDRLENPVLLQEAVSQLLRQTSTKIKSLNLSLPGTLFRLMEIPKMPPESLYTSLSSEAERYKPFANAEAVVDFSIIENAHVPASANTMRVIFGALRKDTLEGYLGVFKSLKIRLAAISLEPIDILRGMAGTGVLDSLVEQIGLEAFWGTIFVEPDRVRFSLWQGSELVEFRETHMPASDFISAAPDSMLVEDFIEEVQRTSKTFHPTIWLAHNLPQNMCTILSERMAVNVRDCVLGNSLTLKDPDLSPAAVGSALISTVGFPFEFNLLSGGLTPSNVAEVAGTGSLASSDASPVPGLLMGAGVVAVVLGLVASGVLALVSGGMQAEVSKMQTDYDAKKQLVDALQAQETVLKDKVSIYQKLKDQLDQARIRNRIYVSVTGDIQNKSPKQLWVQEINIGGKDYEGKIAFEGRALHHDDVIRFAKNFDQTPYIKAFTIDHFKEQKLAGVPLFNYKVLGDLNLDPSLISSSSTAQTSVPIPAETQTNQ